MAKQKRKAKVPEQPAPQIAIYETVNGETKATQNPPGKTFIFKEPLDACFVHKDGRVFAVQRIGGAACMVDLRKKTSGAPLTPEDLIQPGDFKASDGVLFEFKFPIPFCFIHEDGRIFVPDMVRGVGVMIDLVRRVLDVESQRKMQLLRKGIIEI